jgi:two-component sensor histidine kinase
MAAEISIQAEVATNLALAMVAASDAPILLLDGDFTVVAVSPSFCRAFHVSAEDAVDRSVFSLGAGEWDLPKLRSLFSATASGTVVDAYDMDLAQPGNEPRQVVIRARNLEYGPTVAARLLVTVTDVTEARIAERIKDDLIRDKAVLIQEVQHRVANSLQIIASVLMQSARNVQSEETRLHLRDAHHRVMSIASVQQQLAMSSHGDVELRPYFTRLCESLGASMIRDHRKQSIQVTGDSSEVVADVSVSLGLIVTELVINALKHAFPDDRGGVIKVDYQSRGPNWTLSVTDDGVGMPKVQSEAKAGLGSSIVESLAKQLRAKVSVADARPGSSVSVVHTQIAAVEDAEEARLAV